VNAPTLEGHIGGTGTDAQDPEVAVNLAVHLSRIIRFRIIFIRIKVGCTQPIIVASTRPWGLRSWSNIRKVLRLSARIVFDSQLGFFFSSCFLLHWFSICITGDWTALQDFLSWRSVAHNDDFRREQLAI